MGEIVNLQRAKKRLALQSGGEGGRGEASATRSHRRAEGQ